MAGINGTVTFEHAEYRPCLVDGEKALFHRWVDEEKLVLHIDDCFTDYKQAEKIREICETSRIISINCGTEKIRATLAIVELANGMIKEVEPTQIRFVDNKINEFAFCDGRRKQDDNWIISW